MVKNNIIAFYPYSLSTNSYHGMIQEMLEEEYFVIDYSDLKKDFFHPEEINAIYFNWIEDVMDDVDRELIIRSAKAGVRIFWTFHNRVSHAAQKEKECRENILFLIEHVSDIIILSRASISYLQEYAFDIKESKIHFLPHPEYIGNYGSLEDKELKEKFCGTEFVFGSIGSIRPDKNIELLIKAFQRFSHYKNSMLLISGGIDSHAHNGYLESLEKLIGDNKNVCLIPNHIPDDMMNFYIRLADVILLPYNLKTSMNSGVMLLAFTNKRTVLSSDISMAEEFKDKLFYKYSYTDEEDHINQILRQMEKAYADGRETVRKKGEILYEEILRNNSKNFVKEQLYEIIGRFPVRASHNAVENFKKAYQDNILWHKKYAMADAWLSSILSGNQFLQRVKENGIQKIAIYGYGKYGKMLHAELVKEGMYVDCIIDINAVNIHGDIKVCTLDYLEEKLDLVIVTTAAANIRMIREYCCRLNEDCYVISLKDIL